MSISICLWMAAVLAAPVTLDRDVVIALARERAPVILAARTRTDAAAGELAGARAWRYNPAVEFEAGPRTTPAEETWDRSVRLEQRLDLAGRGARIDAASAGVDAVRHEVREAEVAVVAAASRAHLLAVHAQRTRATAEEAAAVQQRLHDVARARHEAGETGALELNLATLALARARAAAAGAGAAEAAALSDLASILQLSAADIAGVRGDLAWPSLPDLAAAQTAAAAHPRIGALAARRQQAEALRREAGAAGWPQVGVFGGWGREEDADIVHVGLNVDLPLFSRGQGDRRVAAAEAEAARIEYEAARSTIHDQVARAWQRQHALQVASEAMSRDAQAALAASVRLAEESFRLGEIGLDETLLVQREQFDAQIEIYDLELAAALAAVDVAEIAALAPLAEGETP
jgi:outer membrane protein TolC